MKRVLTCTVCPRGCEITAEYTSKDDIKLTGYSCERGKKYAMDECFEPKRVFTSSVRAEGLARRMLPVRTDVPIDRDLLLKAAEEARNISVSAAVKSGQILREDFLGTGAALISSMSLEEVR